MATWYEIQRKNREASRRLRGRESGTKSPCSSRAGRGWAFGRKPVGIPARPQTGPKSESPDGQEKRGLTHPRLRDSKERRGFDGLAFFLCWPQHRSKHRSTTPARATDTQYAQFADPVQL